MKNGFTLAAFAALVFGLYALAGCGGSDEAKNSSSFTTAAARSGMTAVRLGNLALAKGQSEEVRRFAESTIADRLRANSELKEIAARKNVALPTEINDGQKSLIEKLSKLSGAKFDERYVEIAIENYEKEVKEFQTQADGGMDADVKAFAARTLPTMRAHLKAVKSVEEKY